MSDVFKKLNAVDVREYSERKGQFTYLPWSDAWTVLMRHYPEATHDMLDDVYYRDGTMEVRSSVTVNGQTLKCFLPVIDHKNRAITNPNAFDVNKNRMRCLAKNISLFGLGLYLFRGEDLPSEDDMATTTEHQPTPQAVVAPVPIAPVAVAPVAAPTPVTPDQPQTGTVIADESGAEDITLALVNIAKSMHSESVESLVEFWQINKQTIDALDGRFPNQYAKLKAAFTEIKQALSQPQEATV